MFRHFSLLETSKVCLIAAVMAVNVLVCFEASAGDLENLKARGVLRHLGIPYANFITGAGDGLDVELMQEFSRYLGVEYKYIKEDWGTIFSNLSGRQIRQSGSEVEFLANTAVTGDVAANGITVLPWRQKVVKFSAPTFPNQVWLVARANSPLSPIKPGKDLQRDIAAVKQAIGEYSLLGKAGTCLDPSLYKLEEVTGKIKLFKGTLNEVAPALLNFEADLTLLDVPDALVALQKWPGQIKIIGPISEQQDMAVAFAEGSPELLAAFNAFYKQYRESGAYAKLVTKYYPFVFDYFPDFFS